MPAYSSRSGEITFYSVAVFWAGMFAATMWRLTTLHNLHWLQLVYLGVAVAWALITSMLVICLRIPAHKAANHPGLRRLASGTLCCLLVACIAFICIVILDITVMLG